MKALIKKLKKEIKKEDEYIEKCEEYSKDPDFINGVEISFDDNLDVSAKTVNGEIFLNGKLFDGGDWDDQMRYVIHEITHVMQQEAGKVKEKTDRDDYLDDENEIEAFQAQLSYMSENESPEEIQKYLEQLLDHHGIKGKERKLKIEELTEDV
jgi:hypothetical protein